MSLPALLAEGGRALVIGARESNVPEFWNHPQVVFLDGRECTRRGVPANVKVILITRFVQHSDVTPLLREARKRHLTVFPYVTTGILKTTLSELLAQRPIKHVEAPKLPVHFAPIAPKPIPSPEPLPSPVPESVSEPEPMTPSRPKRRGPGTLTADILAQLAQHPEYKVSDLVKAMPGASASSINSAYYRLRNQGMLAKVPPKVNLRSPLGLQAPPDLVMLIDDAISALQLVREAAVQDRTRRTELQKLLDHFKTL